MSDTRHPSEPDRPRGEPAQPAQAEPCGQGHPPNDTPNEGAASDEAPGKLPRLQTPPKGRRLARPRPAPAAPLSAEQRLLLLDAWRRSGLPAGDFAGLVGLSKHTLYDWKRRFEAGGPAALMDRPRGAPAGSRLGEVTRRAILMLKADHPDWGCQRISDVLLRGPALGASPAAVARVLHEAGYRLEEAPTKPHPQPPRRFERDSANQLWQTDLFSFVLKRQNRRVYLVAFLDDHSRFLVGYGLHASQSTALVLEVLRASLSSYGPPKEVLTDNGSQYVTWRGKSAFSRELERLGVRQVVAAPRHPQTLGKVERFWGTLWRECLEGSVFVDLADAQRRVGLFIDHYNFQRPHQGIDGLAPADRYFGAAPEVLRTLRQRVAANALELARHGLPKKPFYLTGQVGGQNFSVHAEGERVILQGGKGRQEIDLTAPAPRSDEGASLPEPVCPQGRVADSWAAVANTPPPAPGVAALSDREWIDLGADLGEATAPRPAPPAAGGAGIDLSAPVEPEPPPPPRRTPSPEDDEGDWIDLSAPVPEEAPEKPPAGGERKGGGQ
jgi:transposase InsO family protein